MTAKQNMKRLFENLAIIISSIVIGVPLGLIVGIICWFKFPFQVYNGVRIELTNKRIEQAKELIKQHKKESSVEGMWDRHINRMEEKKNYYN